MIETNITEEDIKIEGSLRPQKLDDYIGQSKVKESLITDGCEIYGEVYRSILGPGVIVKKGAVVRDSIIMCDSVIGENSVLDRTIVDEECTIGDGVQIGVGENAPNEAKPNIYYSGISVVGVKTTVPNHVTIGKNCVIYGETAFEDYPEGKLESGKSVTRGM